jgi:class 3 adenylate cyclase/predicted ATPase
MAACARCAAQNPDGARFCGTCGSALEKPATAEHERRLVTVVFVDLVDSTGAAEILDPEDVQRRLDTYFRRLRAELERYGGRLEKFIGDAVVALFGAPVTRGEDAERAVRAAIAALTAIDALNAEDPTLALAVRIGVNTGEALVALDARVGEGMAWGDVLNTAARIQAAAAPGAVLVGGETWRATRRTIAYREHEPVAAKGKAAPIRVWEAVGISRAPATGSPFVGREPELATLEALWREVVREQRAALALVTGPPGIGKSRLARELAQRVGCATWSGRALPYGEGITYWPIAELLRQAAHVAEEERPEDVTPKLEAMLAALPVDDADERRTISAAVFELLEVGRTQSGEAISRAELHWGVRRFVELSARERPLLVVLEDLDWAEPTLLELLEMISTNAAAPLLLLCAARSSLELPATVELELEPLDDAASKALLRQLVGDAPADLVERAEGNALFLEELAGAYLEGAETIPSTLQALIGARLDALAPPARRVAQHAAVCGAVFSPAAVAAITDVEDVAGELDELERRGLVFRRPAPAVAEPEWVFKHLLIRDVAYGRLPKARRAQLHGRFAAWTSSLGAADDFVEIRAWHLEQACLLARQSPPVEEAVAALTAAGEKAERREGNREADRFYERALALAALDADDALDLRFRRARLLAAIGKHEAAAAALTEIADEARLRDLEAVLASALIALGNVETKRGRVGNARSSLAEASAIARSIGDESAAVRAEFELAQIRGWFDGDVDAAVAQLDALLPRIQGVLRTEARLRKGAFLFNAGRLAQAEAELLLARSLALEDDDARNEARALALLGPVRYYRSGCAAGVEDFLRAEAFLARTADVHLQIQNARWLAKCALRVGYLTEAEHRLQAVLPDARDHGGWLEVEIYRYLLEVLIAQGRTVEASAALADARALTPPEGQYERAALLLCEALAAHGAEEPAAAETAFARAFELLEAQSLILDLAEAQLLEARLTGSRDKLQLARTGFARAGATSFVREIDAALETPPAGVRTPT